MVSTARKITRLENYFKATAPLDKDAEHDRNVLTQSAATYQMTVSKVRTSIMITGVLLLLSYDLQSATPLLPVAGQIPQYAIWGMYVMGGLFGLHALMALPGAARERTDIREVYDKYNNLPPKQHSEQKRD